MVILFITSFLVYIGFLMVPDRSEKKQKAVGAEKGLMLPNLYPLNTKKKIIRSPEKDSCIIGETLSCVLVSHSENFITDSHTKERTLVEYYVFKILS